MTITNKAFRNAMENAGLEKVQLEKETTWGYFYLWSNDETIAHVIAGIFDNAINTHAFKDMSVEEWVETIKAMMQEGIDTAYYYVAPEDRPITIKASWKN